MVEENEQKGVEHRIALSETEWYVFALPKTLDRGMFSALMHRLQHIEKMLIKDPLQGALKASSPLESGEKKRNQEKNLKWLIGYFEERGGREFFIKCARLYYSPQQQNLEKLTGVRLSIFRVSTKRMRIHYNIQPIEVGLRTFPPQGMPWQNCKI